MLTCSDATAERRLMSASPAAVQQDCVVTLGEDGVSIRMEDPSKGLQSRVFLTAEVCAGAERSAFGQAAACIPVPNDQLCAMRGPRLARIMFENAIAQSVALMEGCQDHINASCLCGPL